MSVIYFGADELGNIARCLAPGASDIERSTFESYLVALEHISKANGAAYQASYAKHGEHTPGYSASEIRREAPSPVSIQPKRACEDAISLQYNCIANGGTDHADGPALGALVSVLTGLLRKASGRAYPNEVRREIVPASAPGQPISIFDLGKRPAETPEREASDDVPPF